MADSGDPDIVDLATLAQIVTNAGRDDLNVHLKLTRDMSETAASTAKEVARYTYAVPAEEKTKQEKELTKRVGIETAGRLLFGSVLAIAACLNITGHPITLGSVLVAIAGIFAGKEILAAGKELIGALKRKIA